MEQLQRIVCTLQAVLETVVEGDSWTTYWTDHGPVTIKFDSSCECEMLTHLRLAQNVTLTLLSSNSIKYVK